MKFLISVWKILSVPVLLLAGWLGWWGWKHWPAAAAHSRPIVAAELERHKDGVFFVRDSFDFDLTEPGLRQENNYGFLGPALAVFPVKPPAMPMADSASSPSVPSVAPAKPEPTRFAVVSDESRFVGPAVATYLRSDSMSIVDIRVSSTSNQHSGNLGPQMQALIQITANELGHGPLGMPRQGRAFIEGIARMRSAEDFTDLANPAPEVWEIRTGEVPDTISVALAFIGAVLLVGLFVLFNQIAKNFDKVELAREMEELEQEAPLV